MIQSMLDHTPTRSFDLFTSLLTLFTPAVLKEITHHLPMFLQPLTRYGTYEKTPAVSCSQAVLKYDEERWKSWQEPEEKAQKQSNASLLQPGETQSSNRKVSFQQLLQIQIYLAEIYTKNDVSRRMCEAGDKKLYISFCLISFEHTTLSLYISTLKNSETLFIGLAAGDRPIS